MEPRLPRPGVAGLNPARRPGGPSGSVGRNRRVDAGSAAGTRGTGLPSIPGTPGPVRPLALRPPAAVPGRPPRPAGLSSGFAHRGESQEGAHTLRERRSAERTPPAAPAFRRRTLSNGWPGALQWVIMGI
ncbi:hypothetical protein KCH_57060 [Kitasatospora cheerisanensis KCTC 2395]|uniref:Uncharacterized protein n=1 Tax=Kitasatospora cheerisanensis KCTC 2395 TaxID=1348663 RepID=A0A066YM13_9ACTN|nr:hypothetical protein KCH_57060 [Kitasatospora cheerisanensis KCTC 2395]